MVEATDISLPDVPNTLKLLTVVVVPALNNNVRAFDMSEKFIVSKEFPALITWSVPVEPATVYVKVPYDTPPHANVLVFALAVEITKVDAAPLNVVPVETTVHTVAKAVDVIDHIPVPMVNDFVLVLDMVKIGIVTLKLLALKPPFVMVSPDAPVQTKALCRV